MCTSCIKTLISLLKAIYALSDVKDKKKLFYAINDKALVAIVECLYNAHKNPNIKINIKPKDKVLLVKLTKKNITNKTRRKRVMDNILFVLDLLTQITPQLIEMFDSD